jgi:hypothetical protein
MAACNQREYQWAVTSVPADRTTMATVDWARTDGPIAPPREAIRTRRSAKKAHQEPAMQPASPPAGHRRALTSCPSPGLSAALRMCITTHHRPMSHRVDLQIFYGPPPRSPWGQGDWLSSVAGFPRHPRLRRLEHRGSSPPFLLLRLVTPTEMQCRSMNVVWQVCKPNLLKTHGLPIIWRE